MSNPKSEISNPKSEISSGPEPERAAKIQNASRTECDTCEQPASGEGGESSAQAEETGCDVPSPVRERTGDGLRSWVRGEGVAARDPANIEPGAWVDQSPSPADMVHTSKPTAGSPRSTFDGNSGPWIVLLLAACCCWFVASGQGVALRGSPMSPSPADAHSPRDGLGICPWDQTSGCCVVGGFPATPLPPLSRPVFRPPLIRPCGPPSPRGEKGGKHAGLGLHVGAARHPPWPLLIAARGLAARHPALRPTFPQGGKGGKHAGLGLHVGAARHPPWPLPHRSQCSGRPSSGPSGHLPPGGGRGKKTGRSARRRNSNEPLARNKAMAICSDSAEFSGGRRDDPTRGTANSAPR
jgi:hypothetical protein